MSWRRRFVILAVTLALAGWASAAAVARLPWPWAVAMTDLCFALALVSSGVALFALSSLRAPSARVVGLRALTTALTLPVLLALAELPACFGLLDYGRVWGVASGEWSGPATSFVSDPLLGWSRPPHRAWSGRPRSDMAVTWNLSVRAPRVLSFTTDAQGFRNRSDRPRSDVALVGDSYVEGAYVSDDETTAVELERITGWRVANLGRSGYGTLQELEVVRAFAVPQRPRVVAWFFFEGNDLYDDDTYENALAYLKQHGSYAPASGWSVDWGAFRQASLSVNAFRLLRRALDPLVPVSAPSYCLFRGPDGAAVRLYFYQDAALRFDAYEQRRFEKTQQAVLAGAALLRQQDIALRMVFVPSKFRVYGARCDYPAGSPCAAWRVWDLQERFRAFCVREGLPLLDLTNPMSTAAAAGRLLYAPEDSHWNAEGHRFVAELLAAELPVR